MRMVSGQFFETVKGEAIPGMYCPLQHVLHAANAEALALLKGLVLEQIGCG